MITVVNEVVKYNVTATFENVEKRVEVSIEENIFNVNQSTFENTNINGGIIY